MILEGILTTVNADGEVNISPLGPQVDASAGRFVLRPFKGGRSYENLLRTREAVFHVVDDVELLACAAVGDVKTPVRPASVVNGFILEQACRAYELRVVEDETSGERASLDATVVKTTTLRDFFGWNRAKHAVVEAAILATRVRFFSRRELNERLASLTVLVRKTGGHAEHRAFDFLERHIQATPCSTEAEQLRHAPNQPIQRVRVRTGARIHFGLIDPSGSLPRSFGGAGLMVEQPSLEVEAEKASTLQTMGALGKRAGDFAVRYTGLKSPPYALRVQSGFPDHVGLGTGTQLGLAVAAAIAHLEGEKTDTAELSRRVGRGRRSAVGIHGFEHGGLIVEGGKSAPERNSPLLGRYAFPSAWRVVLLLPRSERGVFGGTEEKAFASLPEPETRLTDRLSALLLQAIPALVEEDLDAFGEAIFEYGRRAGELFGDAQRGAFASPGVQQMVEFLRASGLRGVGQSSWGPAVYSFVENEERARHVADSARKRFGLADDEVCVTNALHRGVQIDSQHSTPSLHTLG